MTYHEFDLPAAGTSAPAPEPKNYALCDVELDAEINVEYALLSCFGTDPGRELTRRALQHALGQFGMHPAAARHVIRTTALLVPTQGRRYRLAHPAPRPRR